MKKYYLLPMCLVLIATLVSSSVPVSALPASELKSLYEDSVHYKIPTEGTCSTTAVALSGDSNVAKAFNYLTSNEKGPHLTSDQAAGIVGNLVAESGVLPKRKQGEPKSYQATMSDIEEAIRLNKTDASKGFGIGIAQWTTWSRLEALKKVGDDPLALDTQLTHLVNELNGHGMAELKQANDMRQATWIFLSFFERPATVSNSGTANKPQQPSSGPAKTELDSRLKLAEAVVNGRENDDEPSDDIDPSADTSATATDCESDGSSGGGTSFRIASYNMLVSSSSEQNEIATSNMKKNNFDVIGMQELENANVFKSVSQKLKAKGYDIYPTEVSAPNKKTDDVRNGLQGRAIAYNSDKFELTKSDEITFKRMDGCRAQPAHMPIIWLKDKTTEQVIIVMNTHNSAFGADGGPCGKFSGPAERVDQDKAYIQKIKELQSESLPIFLTGDFNEGYGPGVMGSNNYKKLFHCMATEQKLMKAAEIKNPGEYCKENGRSGNIDHIYVSPQVEVKGTYELNKDKTPMGTDHKRAPYADVVVPGSGGAGDTTEPDFNKKYNVKYDDVSADCAGGQTVGAQSLSDVVMKKYSPPVTSVGGYSCRSNTADTSQLSIHAMGRALDIMIDGTTPKGRETGDRIRNFMINNAEKLGVQAVIWNRHIWTVNHTGWRNYDGPNPHTDHLHVEINVKASKKSNLGKDM